MEIVFGCILCLQINIETDVTANVYYSYPYTNLFFTKPGFANPSISRGLFGFSLNPASLIDTENAEVMITIGPLMRTEIYSEFAIPFDDFAPIIDTVKVPTNLGVEQLGGIDFIGAAFALKGWRFGMGYQKGDYIGLDFVADAKANADYEIDLDYTLTHSDIQEIPVGDSVPVHVSFSGAGDLALTGSGKGDFASRSFIFAIAHKLLGLDCGVGFQITPVSLRGDFNALFGGSLAGIGQISVESAGDWTIDASFEAEIDADSILDCHGDINADFYLSTFYWGIKKEWRHFSIGICGEFSPPLFLNGGWNLLASFPKDLAKIRFDDDSLFVDTINKVISGRAKLVVYDFEKDDTTQNGSVNDLFFSANGITAGMSVRFWRLETGLFAGVNGSSDGSYLRLRAGVNLGFRTFVPLYAGAVLHFQYYDISGIPMSALPVIAFGGGTDFNINKFNIFLNLSGNTTQGAASFIIPHIIGGEKKVSVLFSMGFGIRYQF
jgi:hypothetical protein